MKKKWLYLLCLFCLFLLFSCKSKQRFTIDPKMDTYSYFQKCKTAVGKNQLKQAIEWITKAIEEDPFNANLYYTRSDIFTKLGYGSRSISDRMKGLELESSKILDQFYSKAIYFSPVKYTKNDLSKIPLYLKLENKYLHLSQEKPHDPGPYYQLANLYALNDLSNKAKIFLRLALSNGLKKRVLKENIYLYHYSNF